MATAAAKMRAGEATWNEATLFDFAAFDARPLVRAPFDHLIVPAFLHADALAAVNRDFPPIEGPSNFTPERVTYEDDSLAFRLEPLERREALLLERLVSDGKDLVEQ